MTALKARLAKRKITKRVIALCEEFDNATDALPDGHEGPSRASEISHQIQGLQEARQIIEKIFEL